MSSQKYYVVYGFINDLGEEQTDDLGKISGGFTLDEAYKVVQELQTTAVCYVEWAEIKEMN